MVFHVYNYNQWVFSIDGTVSFDDEDCWLCAEATYPSLPVTVLGLQNDPGPCQECEAAVGRPINVTTGDTWISKTEYAVPGLSGGLSLKRTWNSLWNERRPIFAAGMFGSGWVSNFEERVQVLDTSHLKYWRGSGNTWVFAFPSACQPCDYYIVADPPREHASLRYSTSTFLYTVTFADGTQRIFNNGGYLTKIVDRNGNQTVMTYDGSARITKVTAPGGQWISFTYGNSQNSNLATSAQDSVGTVATYSYSGTLLTRATYGDGGQHNYTYNAANKIIAVADEQGKISETHTYDSNGRGLTSIRGDGVDAITVEYLASGTATVRDSKGNTTSYTHSGAIGGNYLTGIQGPGCDSCGGRNNQSFTLDGSGNRLSSTDPNGNPTSFTYDANGNTLTRTDAAGTWTFTYNNFAQVVTARDRLGSTTTNNYDLNGNLLAVTTPSPDGGTTPGSTTSFTYDSKGQVTQITDPLGNATTLTYYTNGLIKTIKDAQRNTTTLSYDGRGNLTSVKNALNQTTTSAYDALNRLIRVTYPNGAITQFTYDGRGRRTSVIDANNKVTTYSYDDADRLISVRDAANNITRYAYDSENNLIEITDALGRATTFEYNELGGVTKTIFPSSLFEMYSYDTAGNLTGKLDRKGNSITYAYDSLNRLTGRYYPDGTSVTYAYDSNNRLVQVSDATGTYPFTYDHMGRMKQTTTAYSFLPSRSFTVSYAYDAASNRTGLTDPENGLTSYVYETLNRLITLTNFQNQPFTFNYDALGRRTSLSRANNVTTSYTYDTASQLLSLVHKKQNTTLDGTTYTVDAAANRTTRTALPGNITASYAYDAIYQLLNVSQGATTTESYTYDSVRNRLSSLAVSPYTHNSSNELTSTPSVSYTYDNNGNVLTKMDALGTTAYTWDYENRLTAVTLPGSGGRVTFKYDPFGRRIYKSTASGTSIFAYDGQQLLEEVNSAGAVVLRYTQGEGDDEPLATLQGTTTYYYQADGLGSITSLSNSSGSIAATYTYGAFGNVTASTGGVTNAFRYTGRDLDQETGLYYYRARYYDPVTGRFMSEDLKGFGAGANFYSYVRNSPTNFRDPSGLDIAVIENGPTGLLSNPAGHTAIAVTGEGTYSFGNGWFEGKSLEDYLLREAERRNTTVYIIHTTAAQDVAALAYLNSQIGKPLSGVLKDNCSIRSNNALDAAGIGRLHGILRIPDFFPGSAGARASAAGADVIPIPKGSPTTPVSLHQFEPLPYPY